MNILFLTTHVNTGGITSYILTLGEALVKSGNNVWVASSGGDCASRLEAAGIRHITVNIRTKSEIHPKLWLSLPTLFRLVRKQEINIIHSHTRVTQVLGASLSRLSGVAMITTCHGFFRPRWFRKTFPCWGRAVIAISKPVAVHLTEDFGVNPAMVNLIANGIDLDRFAVAQEQERQAIRRKLNMGQGPLIGIIARLSDVKGIDMLLKAMPLILKEIPSANLMIVGRGPQEAFLRKMTQELSLGSKVHFKDVINATQEFLPAFDVFVMPSLMEGLGLSVMEAQACGIPVVASKVGGLVDLIEDGVSGYLVAAGDPVQLARRVVDILQDPQRARMMADRARSNIERDFSVKMMLQRVSQVYEQYSGR